MGRQLDPGRETRVGSIINGVPRGRSTDPQEAVLIPLDGAHNFRDLGGYETSEGKLLRGGWLYRADALNAISSDDQRKLGELGIGRVVDLREDAEREAHPDRIDGLRIDVLAIPLHDNTQLTRERTVVMPATEQYLAYAGAFRLRVAEAVGAVLTSECPVIVHCTAGKDRTGVIIAILLTMLGVDRTSIERDYLASYAFLADGPFWERAAADFAVAGLEKAALDESRIVPPGSIVTMVLDAIASKYGDVEAFLAEHGVDRADIEEFRERMLAEA